MKKLKTLSSWLKNTSIIIPLTRLSYLQEPLKRLLILPFKEIIIVTKDSNIKINNSRVKFISSDDINNVSKARNFGAKHANGKFFLFIDDDVIIEKKTIKYLQIFPLKNFDIVCGKYNDEKMGNNFSTIYDNMTIDYRMFKGNEFNQIYSSSHFIIRNEIFNQSGGFNEYIKGYEDIEFFHRCKILGYKIKFDPTFQATHLKNYNFFSLLKNYFCKSNNALHARYLYPKILKNRINLPFRVKYSWITSGFLFFSIPISFFNNFFWIISFILLFLQIPLLKKIYYKNNTFNFIKSIFTNILIGISVISGSTLAFFQIFFSETKRYTVSFLDYLIALKRVLLKNGLPIQIINYVTSRCNLRCNHCFYKETLDKPDPGEMKLDLLDKTTKEIGPVLWYSLAGGEPFIRKDLPELVALIKKNCRPKVFSFPTNGWYTEKTFHDTIKILQSDPKGSFLLFFSLDGPKKVHDKIRGKGSYDQVKKTVDCLKKIQKLYKNLYLNFVITVTPQNSGDCPNFIKILLKEFNPAAISINLFRYHSLKHPPLSQKLIDDYKKTVDTYKKFLFKGYLTHYGFFGAKILKIKEILQKELIYNVAKFNKFITPCTAGNLSYVIMEDGSLKPCEILSDNLGKITNKKDFSIRKLFLSKKAKNLRSWIVKTKCKCTYECAMSTNTLFTWPMIKKWVKKLPEEMLK